MAFDYDKMQKIAKNLLGPSMFGKPFTLKHPLGKPSYDSAKRKNVQKYEEHTGVCVMKTYTAETIGSLSNIIKAGDVSFVCVMDDLDVIPTEAVDKVEFGGHQYNVLEVSTSNPSGSKILVHTLHARRAV